MSCSKQIGQKKDYLESECTSATVVRILVGEVRIHAGGPPIGAGRNPINGRNGCGVCDVQRGRGVAEACAGGELE